MGSDLPLTAEPSTVTFITSSMSGNSNIVLRRIFSNIDLKPLAPVFLEIAFFEFALRFQVWLQVSRKKNPYPAKNRSSMSDIPRKYSV